MTPGGGADTQHQEVPHPGGCVDDGSSGNAAVAERQRLGAWIRTQTLTERRKVPYSCRRVPLLSMHPGTGEYSG